MSASEQPLYTLELWCYVYRHPSIFSVEPFADTDIYDLKKLIHNKLTNTFANPGKIILWKLHDPLPERDNAILEQISGRGFKVSSFATRLDNPTDKLADVFPQDPPEDCLSIIIEPPHGSTSLTGSPF